MSVSDRERPGAFEAVVITAVGAVRWSDTFEVVVVRLAPYIATTNSQNTPH